MKKLVKGIVDFRKNKLEEYKEKFAKLALEQRPDTLLIACSDSRVVPNLFASTDPGDLFVVRNVGNLIPQCGADGHSIADESEAAAIEFSVANLGVKHIIVCGHSDCGAMHAIIKGREKVVSPNLRAWLRHGELALSRLAQSELSQTNLLSKVNVLEQIEHLKTYPIVKERIAKGELSLHGWWFDLSTADVYSYDGTHKKFIVIDEAEAARIEARI